MKDVIKPIIVSILAILVILWVYKQPKDDTDPPGKRSGMHLFIDNRTGCHYLGHWGITPRLDQDGKQICER